MRLFSRVLMALWLLPLPAHAATVHLGWNASDEPPLHYIMERKIGGDGVYVAVGSTTETTWTETDVSMPTDKAVYWQVRTVNERGISDPSNEVSLSFPSAPENIRLLLQTFGPSATAPRVSIRMKVRKSGYVAPGQQSPGRTKRRKK